jgi:hypothetical protein
MCEVGLYQNINLSSGRLTLSEGTHSRNIRSAWPLDVLPIGCPETSVSANLRRVASQKSEGLRFDAYNTSYSAQIPTKPAICCYRSRLEEGIVVEYNSEMWI